MRIKSESYYHAGSRLAIDIYRNPFKRLQYQNHGKGIGIKGRYSSSWGLGRTPPQSYTGRHLPWDHTVFMHHPTQVNASHLSPAAMQAGTQ